MKEIGFAIEGDEPSVQTFVDALDQLMHDPRFANLKFQNFATVDDNLSFPVPDRDRDAKHSDLEADFNWVLNSQIPRNTDDEF